MMKIDEVLSRGVLEDGLLDAFEPEDVEFAVLAASAHDAWVVSSDDSRLLVSAMVRDPDEGMEPSLVRVWLNDAHGLASVSEDSCGCEEHGRCRHAAAALAAFATKMEAPDVFAAFFDYAGLEGCGEEAPNFDEVRSGKDDADDAGCAIHASRRLGMESFDDVFPNPARTAFADIAAGAEKDGDEDLEGFLALLAKGPSVFLSSFDSGAVRRGKEYWRSGYVLGISYDTSKRVLRGSVDGSERKPYTTTIALSGRGSASPRRLSGECSCYLGGSCKHVVATLMEMEKAYHAAGKAAARTSSTLAPAPSGLPAGRPTSKKTAHGLPVVASSKDLSGQTVGRASGGSAAGAPSKPSRQGLDLIREISSSSADASGASGSDRPAAKTEPFEFAAVLQHQASLLVSGCETLTIDLFRRKGRKGEWSRCTAKDMLLDAATSEESAAARLLLRADEQPRSSGYGYNGRGALLVPKRAVESFGPLLETLVAAGMARMDVPGAAPMKMGEDVPVSIRWKISKNGSQSASIHLAGSKARVLDAEDLWYLDPSKSSLGRVVPDVPVRAFLGLLKAKGLDPADASALRSALDRIPGVPEEAKPRGDIAFVEDSSPPTPVLSFFQVKKDWRRKSDAEALSLTFDYGGKMGRDGESRAFDGKVVRVRRRDPAFEASVRDAVVQWGWAKERYASATDPYVFSGDDGELMRFAQTLLPEMEEAGWRISGVAGNPRLTVLDAAGEWEIDEERPGPDGTAGWWFELGLGFEVDGKKIDLLPVLRDVVRRLAGDKPAREALAAISDGTRLHGRLPDGRGVAVLVERVRPLVEALIELFDRNPSGNLNLAQASGLAEVMAAIGARWMGSSRIASLVEALRSAAEGGIVVEPQPEGFLYSLRPYQNEGVAWMRFLAANRLGGVLADDMGLGKTIQALAHLLDEKVSGRSKGPSLVVCPTSVVPVWISKAKEAAPSLKVVVLHGSKRAERRKDVETADLVVTTYPLLSRDEDFLKKISWHAAILDEAQAIKNPSSKWTQVACGLQAHHRLCLTGTPVENHLGEAWSQFAFLMPGILGDSKSFSRDFRRPIEEKGDSRRRMLLARRLKPFMLRRTKSAVATELPPKTEIIEKVSVVGAQRDLYETVRLAMDAKVQEAIAERGLARSHIVVLDALLKLRQICCAPALLKGALGATAKRASSAKLERLMEMLPQMIEEGRRILLFSQFTEMLDLIKHRLDAEGISYVEITGDTKDRATPVERFQAGEVPLFLISLKAGGTGLTLTAADTVIHYDPWWNPAVEDQATDRAHRIGQEKSVFVYKFIASGTVEERMTELQARKRDLASAVFDPDAADSVALAPEDVAALFAPLEDEEEGLEAEAA